MPGRRKNVLSSGPSRSKCWEVANGLPYERREMRDERREKKGLTDVSGVCFPRLDSPLNSEELLSTEKHLNPFLCFSAFSLLSVQWSQYSCFLQTFLISLAFLGTLVSESGSLVELLPHLVSTFPCWVHGFKYSLEFGTKCPKLWTKLRGLEVLSLFVQQFLSI